LNSRSVLCCIALGTLVAGASAAEPLDLIPADNLLCWKGLPLPDVDRSPEGPSSLGTLIDLFGRISGQQLGPKEQLTIRIFETLGVVARYPFAVALIDTRATGAREDGSGSKVDRLRIAAVIKTDGDSAPFLRIIQKTVRSTTDAGVASLSRKQAGKWTYQELRDSRLPPWCVIAWGQLDEHFVITVGQGVWEQIAEVATGRQRSMNADPWVAAVRKQYQAEPLIEVVVSIQRIRKRLDPFVKGRATGFFRVWDSAEVERVHWALGFEGRALYCITNSHSARGDVRRVYADPRLADEHLLSLVPQESRYAVYNVRVARFLPRLISSFYATRSNRERQQATALWNKVQRDLGIDAQRDVLDNMGRRILLHNYPRHPLHLPLAFTTLIEIQHNPEQVRASLEKLCTAWQEAIDRSAADEDRPAPARLERDDDGIWFVQFGPVAGLAWTFTDRYIVASWSPKALREYLERFGDRLDDPPTTHAARRRPPAAARPGG